MADAIVKLRPYWIKVGTKLNNQHPYKKTRLAEVHRDMPWEDRGRDRGDRATIQGLSGISGNQQKLKEAGKNPSWETAEGVQPS